MKEREADEREGKLEAFEKGVRTKYSDKLSKLEAKIMSRLERGGGYYFFEHSGGGVAREGVMETELKSRDQVVEDMKDQVEEATRVKREVELEKEALRVLNAQVKQAKVDLEKLKRTEIKKRLELERKIEDRFVKNGAVVLEQSGKTVVTPNQVVMELAAREEQLQSSARREKEKAALLESAKEKHSKEVAEKDREIKRQAKQLKAFRLAQRTRLQKEKRNLARELKNSKSG